MTGFQATETGDPSTAFLDAAMATMLRDALWKELPSPEPGCEHDFELLRIIEFRQTVICANCGGLDVERSRTLQRDALKMWTGPDGGIYVDGVRIVSRIREV